LDRPAAGTPLALHGAVARPLIALLLVACAGEDAATVAASLSAREVLLDQRGDARLIGLLHDAPIDGDADRVLTLRGDVPPELDGVDVLDARFGAQGIVVLGADHVLSDGTTPIDSDVVGPIAVRGSIVAYARGQMPDYEIVRADLRTGAIETITQGMAPAWSPALSSDGREIVFVSSVTGTPRLYRYDGAAHLLPPSRFPTSPIGPRWENGVLAFEDELGTTEVVIP
jgi:hypothetical protein